MGANDHVPDKLGVDRNFQTQGILHCAHGDNGVNRGAHATDSLGENPGIPRITALHDLFDAPPHLPGRPSFGHLAVLHIDVDTQMPLDTSHGVNRYSCYHCRLSPQMVCLAG
jgi:hypothetical protein